jgi:hypothetical protein
VVLIVAALGAVVWVIWKLTGPKDGKNGQSIRAPKVDIVPRTDPGEQTTVSPGPVTSGLTLHPVTDPGEQTLLLRGLLLLEGREP